jgi:hypothetical protein
MQLVVRDALGVIDAPVQSYVESEGEQAHGVGFYEKRAQRATTPRRWVSARRNGQQRIHHPDLLRSARTNRTPSRAILQRVIERTHQPRCRLAGTMNPTLPRGRSSRLRVVASRYAILSGCTSATGGADLASSERIGAYARDEPSIVIDGIAGPQLAVLASRMWAFSAPVTRLNGGKNGYRQ